MATRGRPPKKNKVVEEKLATPVPEVAPEPAVEVPDKAPVEEESHQPQVAEIQSAPAKHWSGQEVLSVKPSLQMPGFFEVSLLNGSIATLPKEECELYNLL